METKVYRRKVSVIEVHKDSEFLGYYTGRDRNDKLYYDKNLSNAMVIKTVKGIEHILYNLNKFHGSEFIFIAVCCSETFSSTYYDEYDDCDHSNLNTKQVVRVKYLADPLSEPTYLSDYNKAENTFAVSFDISKAVMLGKRGFGICRRLSQQYGDKFNFYQEPIFLKKERNIALSDNL